MIQRSLTLKLLAAFLLVGLIGIVVVAVLAGRTTTTELDRFILEQARTDFITNVSEYYQQTGAWAGVDEMLRRRTQFPPPAELPPAGDQDKNRPAPKPPPPPPNTPPIQFILTDQRGRVIVPGPPYRRSDHVPETVLEQGTPIEIEGQTVGTVLDPNESRVRNPAEARFLARINRALIYAAIGAAAIALLLGIFLARTLTRPLRELTTATQAVAQGQLEHQVPVRSQDELGQLAASFNRMSADLAHANQLRRQMTADIAHDLRSPLAVIAGYIESLRDGVLQPNPEMFDTMYSEAQHLQRLVEDLRTLSLADANELPLHRVPVAVESLLNKLASSYEHQANQKQIRLQVKATSSLPEIRVDPERMTQVLGNLVNNALRYTPQNGQITLSAQAQTDAVLLKVQDNGSGISPKDLPHIFERFYRIDKSRQQNNGQSGLGLAIAKSIVKAHGGKISAESEPGLGTTFTIKLPLTAV